MPVSLPEVDVEQVTRLAPRWQVVLLNDDDHTYEYVIEMLVKLFQHSVDTAFRMVLVAMALVMGRRRQNPARTRISSASAVCPAARNCR